MVIISKQTMMKVAKLTLLPLFENTKLYLKLLYRSDPIHKYSDKSREDGTETMKNRYQKLEKKSDNLIL